MSMEFDAVIIGGGVSGCATFECELIFLYYDYDLSI